jgi:hypothetical protein
MARVKLNLRELSVTELSARLRQIATAMTNNPNFTHPQPPLADMLAAADTMDIAYTNHQIARQAVTTTQTILRESQDVVERLLRQEAAYVESISGDDEKVILSAGMGVRSASSSSVPVTTPTGLNGTAGDREGEIDLNWDKVKGAKSYVIERSLDPPTATSYSHAAVSLKSSMTLTGLTSGTRYWFRVGAVMTGGQSGWSDPTTKIAP